MDQNDNNNFWDQPTPTGQPTPATDQPTQDNPAPATPTDAPTTQPSDEEILNNLTDQEVIDYFVRGIMQEKGANVGDEETQNKIFEDLKTELLKQIDRSLIAELPDDKLEEFNRMATENGQIDPNMVAQAVADAGIDINSVTVGTMEKFREIYLGEQKADETEAEPIETEGNN